MNQTPFDGDEQPAVVCLPSGVSVSRAAVDILDSLRRNGHRVSLDERGDLRVSNFRRLHPDAAWMVDSLQLELEELLDEEQTVHG